MLSTIFSQLTKEHSYLSDETIKDWKTVARVVEQKKGTQLVKQGNYTNKLYFIYSGSAKAYHHKNGVYISDWFSFSNEFICAITGYFSGIPSEHYIELTEDSILLETRREDMSDLAKKHHDYEHFSRLTITKIMLQLQQRVVSLQFSTAQERYEFLLQQYPEIERHIALGDIASYIGITQETLSRIRSRQKLKVI